MRRLVPFIACLALASPLVLTAAQAAAASDQVRTDTLSVRVDQTAIDVSLGDRFSFSSTVGNQGDRPRAGLIAHLNILSSDPGVYVDPEDWSTHRTQFLAPLPPRTSTALSWPMQAVNTGPLIIYVAVTDLANHRVTASGPIEVTVTGRRTINAGGILPLAVGVPGAVAATLIALLIRRRLYLQREGPHRGRL